jgi:hypothetical protein
MSTSTQLEAVDDVEALDQSWAAVSCHLGIFHDPVKVPDGDDPEPGYPSPTLQAVLAQHSPDITVTVVSLADILAGCLSDSEKCYTALCVPGGFAPNYSSRLGARGIAIIRDFVSRGGGFVGICDDVEMVEEEDERDLRGRLPRQQRLPRPSTRRVSRHASMEPRCWSMPAQVHAHGQPRFGCTGSRSGAFASS